MNTPIISPLWFYLIGTVPKIGGTLADIAFAIFVICIVTFIVVFVMEDVDSVQESLKITFVKMKRKFILAIVLLSLSNLVPSKEVCYQMAAASLVTPANIGATQETAKEAIDYIIESIDILLEENTIKDKESD